jgi:hypothetical protein
MDPRIEPICPCPRLKDGGPWVARFGGHSRAFQQFTASGTFEHVTVSGIICPGSHWRLPWGLRRSCRGIPLAGRAHAGKEPGGGRLRARSRKNRAVPGPTGRARGSLRTAVARRIETRDVSHNRGSSTGVQGDHPPGTGVAGRSETADGSPSHGSPSRGSPSRGSPSHGSPSHGSPSHGSPRHGSGTAADGDRPLRTAVARRTATAGVNPSHGSGTAVHGDPPLGTGVGCRIGTAGVSHRRGSGTGVHGDRRHRAEENNEEEGGTDDRSAARGEGLEPVQILCLAALLRRSSIVLVPMHAGRRVKPGPAITGSSAGACPRPDRGRTMTTEGFSS